MSVRQLAVAALPAALLLGWINHAARGVASPNATPQAAEPARLSRLYFGNAGCGGATCHGSASGPKQGEDRLDGFSTLFARHTEMQVWQERDRHQLATRVLTEPRGRRMAELLGIKGDVTDPAAHRHWQQCLNCHGVAIADEKEADSESFAPKQRIANGVSCVVCHGPHAEWVNAHVKPVGNNWRTLTREEKRDKFGLTDLWDPVRRAELCCSCHVGSAAERKVVTHEMYAAGHPPLASFEIVTFSDAMPRHWETLAEKYHRLPKAKAIYEKAYQLSEDVGEQQVRLLLTSAVISLRSSAQIVAAYAKADRPGTERDWPEFALYDCYACHHDLKSDSWRQKRGYAGKPGRPQMTAWPLALAPLAIPPEPRAAAADYRKRLAALQSAFSKTPFGDPADVLPAADAMAVWSDMMLKQVQHSRYDVGKLLTALLQRNENALLDFDSARQVSWTVQVLLKEAYPGLFDSAKVKEPLDRLREQLALALPTGKQPMPEEYTRTTMTKRAEYDTSGLQKEFRALAGAVIKR
jgi:hypothetical protein